MNKQEQWNNIFHKSPNYTQLEDDFFDNLVNRFGVVLADSHILDLGCGMGDLAISLAQRGVWVSAVDFSKIALDEAQKKSTALNLNNQISFREVDLENIKEGDIPGQFDIVFLKLVLAFIENKEQILEFIKEKLVSDGAFILITPVLDPEIDEWQYSEHLKKISIRRDTVENLLDRHFSSRRIIYQRSFEKNGVSLGYLCKNP